jgi:hypothetical protein
LDGGLRHAAGRHRHHEFGAKRQRLRQNQEMLRKGSKRGESGASGYAPGH